MRQRRMASVGESTLSRSTLSGARLKRALSTDEGDKEPADRGILAPDSSAAVTDDLDRSIVSEPWEPSCVLAVRTCCLVLRVRQ